MAASVSRRAIIVAGAGIMTAISGLSIIFGARKRSPEPIGYPVPLAEIPLQGGIVYVEQGIVVTQPAEGDFRAFDSKCPHDNCDVGEVRDGKIICFCHGSLFGLDGSLARGPARKSLKRRESEVYGDNLVITDLPPEGLTHRDCGCGDRK